MNTERVKELLAKAGAVIDGHFVGTNGGHFTPYIAKDHQVTCLPSIASELCAGLARRFANSLIHAVVGPAVGAVPLSTWMAVHLSQLNLGYPEVLALFSEHDEEDVGKTGEGRLILRRPWFVLKCGFAEKVAGKCVLAIEDTLTTGGSALQTVRAIRQAGGHVVGLAVLVNGGAVTAKMCEVPRLEALLTIDQKIYTEIDCAGFGLCARREPLNTNYGHGAAFLARQGR